MEKIVWEIPLRTVSEANSSEHWSVSSKRHRQQQFFVRALFHGLKAPIPLPCKITLTRLNSRFLDGDNLVCAFKFLRDEIALCIFPEKRKSCILKNGKIRSIKGLGDSDSRIIWKYAQEKNSRLGVRIEIEPFSYPEFPDNSNKASSV